MVRQTRTRPKLSPSNFLLPAGKASAHSSHLAADKTEVQFGIVFCYKFEARGRLRCVSDWAGVAMALKITSGEETLCRGGICSGCGIRPKPLYVCLWDRQRITVWCARPGGPVLVALSRGQLKLTRSPLDAIQSCVQCLARSELKPHARRRPITVAQTSQLTI